MSVVQNPITGRTRGKFANAVFSKWKGKNTMRSKALQVRNPQTDGQLKQRAKFSILVHLSTLVAALLRVGMKEMSSTVTQFNAFITENSFNGFLSWTGTQWNTDYTKLVVSKGSLDPTNATLSAMANNDTSVDVNFAPSATGNQSVGDKACILVVTPNETKMKIAEDARSTGGTSVNLDTPITTGQVVHVYIFFVSADGRKVSDSQYIGDTV